MKSLPLLLIVLIVCSGCEKRTPRQDKSTIEEIYAKNEKKLSINDGIWGTVAVVEGNCMPMASEMSTCKTYPVRRSVRVYAYTRLSQALPVSSLTVYDSFSTPLIAEILTDAEGFFEWELPAGHYTVVVLEKGKLYAGGLDGAGGINPVEFSGGKMKLNLTISYAAY